MLYMAKKVANSSKDDSNLFAFLAVLLSIVGFIIAYAAKKDNKYVMYYAKQSLVLFFAWIILWVVTFILSYIPVLGMVISWLAYLGLVILWVIGLIYSLSGEMKEIPIVGQYAKKFNF